MNPLLIASAGLDVVSGVFGYMDSFNEASIANSRADMIRAAANADAQRYAEKAQADLAQQKVMYTASGVTLSGSPIDVLDHNRRIMSENINAIRRGGELSAFDQEQEARRALAAGRNALVGGFTGGAKNAYMASILGAHKGATGFSGPDADSAGTSGDFSGVA
ncbi:MAG: hypothetical protein V4510_13490 [bacterium]